MSDNFNDQFNEWMNSEAEKKTKSDDGNIIVNEAYDDTDDNTDEEDGMVEQVSSDLFGLFEAGEANDTNVTNTTNEIDITDEKQDEKDNDPDNDEDIEERIKKTSFVKLRDGKKVPRLKKNMVLAMIVGGIFAFLFVINIFLQKSDEKKQYFEEYGNYVSTGNDFQIDDIMRKSRFTDDDDIESIESAEFYLRTPPSYEPVIANKAIPSSTGPVQQGYNPAGTNYSDSEQMAIKAQIGKEGGYGFAPIPASYSYQDQTDYFNYRMEGQIPSRDEYTRQRIDELAKLTQINGNDGQINADRVNNGQYSEAGKYSQVNTQAGSGLVYFDDNCLFPGTIIHAILVSRIDTDYPGPIHARVTENVYDSMTGKKLLIPQGSILQGSYSSSSVGVSKVQIAWESMVVNYAGIAYQVSLGGMAGVDKRGRSGISGMLDDHYFEWLKAAGIVTLFTMLNSEIAYQTAGQTNQQLRELMDINQGIVGSIGNRLMERAMNIQPTVRVANGTSVSVSVNTPLTLRAFPAIQAEEKYIRR
jgi:type IV secretion system protein VirB10